jgi:hypothetical protein
MENRSRPQRSKSSALTTQLTWVVQRISRVSNPRAAGRCLTANKSVAQTPDLTVAPAYIRPQFNKLSQLREADNTHSAPAPDRTQLACNGVNPWDLERVPNPVIFPHLADPSGEEGLRRFRVATTM